MTAKEQLLARAPGWTEEQARRALYAAERTVEDWGDLEAESDRLLLESARAIDVEERAAGLGAWPERQGS